MRSADITVPLVRVDFTRQDGTIERNRLMYQLRIDGSWVSYHETREGALDRAEHDGYDVSILREVKA